MTMKTDAQILESHSQIVNVPIDEKRALTLKVSPTYTLDEVNSVTLKSFRKIVGYDTFESIRKKNRNEAKDTSDYYNVTVSMMVRRKPAEASAAPARDPYAPDGAPSLPPPSTKVSHTMTETHRRLIRLIIPESIVWKM